jgi:hypothetical protein
MILGCWIIGWGGAGDCFDCEYIDGFVSECCKNEERFGSMSDIITIGKPKLT